MGVGRPEKTGKIVLADTPSLDFLAGVVPFAEFPLSCQGIFGHLLASFFFSQTLSC